MTTEKPKAKKRAPSRANAKAVEKAERVSIFIDHYVLTRNATEAAKKAGYSQKTAGSIGHALLKNIDIRAEVDKRINAASKEMELTRERVLAEYMKIAFMDVRKFYNPDGSLKAIVDLDDDTAAGLAGFDVTQLMGDGENGIQLKKIKLSDKRAALDSIAKFMGWNKDTLTIKGDAENPLQVLVKQISGTALKPIDDDDND